MGRPALEIPTEARAELAQRARRYRATMEKANQARSDLLRAVDDAVTRQGLPPAAVARAVGLTPPEVSRIVRKGTRY